MRAWRILFCGVVLSTTMARADQAADIARIHLDVIGGVANLAAIKSLKMTGHVTAGGKRMAFTMWAARPASVRLEIKDGGRVLVQATDGLGEPWELDSSERPRRARRMNEAAARTFTADAEFDDPLIGGAARGYSIEYAGEVPRGGVKLWRLFVTRNGAKPYSLIVDPETYFVTAREEERATASGALRQIVTRYGDYSPVDNVLMPFRITVISVGKVEQETVIDKIETNPELEPGIFSRTLAELKGK